MHSRRLHKDYNSTLVEELGAEGHRKVVSEFSLVSFVFLIAPRWRRREEVKKRKEKMVNAQKGKTVRQFR
jgi:hypothetical protein